MKITKKKLIERINHLGWGDTLWCKDEKGETWNINAYNEESDTFNAYGFNGDRMWCKSVKFEDLPSSLVDKETKDKEEIIKALETKGDKIANKIFALRRVMSLLNDKIEEARDMVENVPQNIYINEWKERLISDTIHMDKLQDIERELCIKHDKVWQKINELENE